MVLQGSIATRIEPYPAVAFLNRYFGAFIIALTLLSSVPLLFISIPPLADLPAHLARYYLESDPGRAGLRGYFDFHWRLSGNLGSDILIYLLAKALGVEIATKLISAATPVLIGIGISLLSRAVHGRIPVTSPIALCLAYAWPFQMGFLNFWLSVAFALIGSALWIRASGISALLRWALFAPVACLVWLTHLSGWGILLITCWSFEVTRPLEDLFSRLIFASWRCLPLLTALIPMAMWTTGQGNVVGEWARLGTKLQWLAGTLRDRWAVFDLVSLLVVMTCIALPMLARRRFAYAKSTMTAGILLFVIAGSGPELVFGSMFAASRLFAVALILMTISIIDLPSMSERYRSIIGSAAIIFCVLRIGATTVSFQIYDRAYRTELGLMAPIHPHAAVAAFVGQPCPGRVSNWTKSRFEHLPALAVVRRNAFVNNLFTDGFKDLAVTYRAAGPFKHEASSHVSNDLAGCSGGFPPALATLMPSLPLSAFDYVWLIDVPPELWPKRQQLKLVMRTEDSALFKVKHLEE